MSRLFSMATTIKQDLALYEINSGFQINGQIRRIENKLDYLNMKANKIDKTADYYGWHFPSWTHFSYVKDKKIR